jgi:hypothetical protein
MGEKKRRKRADGQPAPRPDARGHDDGASQKRAKPQLIIITPRGEKERKKERKRTKLNLLRAADFQ